MTDETTTPPAADCDPSNTDVEQLTAALNPNDDVFSLVNPEEPHPLVDAPDED